MKQSRYAWDAFRVVRKRCRWRNRISEVSAAGTRCRSKGGCGSPLTAIRVKAMLVLEKKPQAFGLGREGGLTSWEGSPLGDRHYGHCTRDQCRILISSPGRSKLWARSARS